MSQWLRPVKSVNRLLGQNPTMGNLLRVICTLTTIACVGMFGFHWIEGWGFFDSLYMSIITLTTVGFSEVYPLSDQGRIFVVVYLVIGGGASLYSLALLGEILLKVQLFNWLGPKVMNDDISTLKKHVVVFGYGRMGRILCQQLRDSGRQVVVVEKHLDSVVESRNQGFHTVHGDPTEDEVLEQLALDRATGIAVVFGHDPDNIFVVLAARLAFQHLHITARASTPKCQHMLEKAGADDVVCPY